ncbi:DUF3736 domain-containing protein [Streptomyces anulatus]
MYDTRVIDEHTGSLVRRTLDGDQALRIEDTRYSYDAAGNTLRISSTSGQDSAATTDTQCFALDALRRMTEAWTTKAASDGCASGPSATTVGGPDSYWHSYTYDVAGNRAKEVRHTTASGVSDITRTYIPGKAGEANPHALRSITTTGGPDDGGRENFTYDKVGNTASRSGGARGQGFVWDAEGNLAEITENGKSTAYLYDSSGNRLLARNADATTTAYLPGGNQLTVTASGAKTATRYYTHGGETVAVRSSTGISFVFADHQGTGLTAVGFTEGQAVTRNHLTRRPGLRGRHDRSDGPDPSGRPRVRSGPGPLPLRGSAHPPRRLDPAQSVCLRQQQRRHLLRPDRRSVRGVRERTVSPFQPDGVRRWLAGYAKR